MEMKIIQKIEDEAKQETLKAFRLADVGSNLEQECFQILKENGLFLEYLREQTPELCQTAIKQTYHALKFVHHQTKALGELAIQQSPFAVRYLSKDDLSEMEYDRLVIQGLSINPHSYVLRDDEEVLEPLSLLDVHKQSYFFAVAKQDANRLERISRVLLSHRVWFEMLKQHPSFYHPNLKHQLTEDWIEELRLQLLMDSSTHLWDLPLTKENQLWERLALLDVWNLTNKTGVYLSKKQEELLNRLKLKQEELNERWDLLYDIDEKELLLIKQSTSEPVALLDVIHKVPSLYMIVPYEHQNYRLSRYATRLNRESKKGKDDLDLEYFSYHFNMDQFFNF